jgi:Protein of unknown function (DUF2934)
MDKKKISSKRSNAAKTTAGKRPAVRSAEPLALTLSEEEIALKAYALWEERGRPIGSADEDWRNARTQLYERQS